MQLVATYHCDQAYAFDVSSTGSCASVYGSSNQGQEPDSSDAADVAMPITDAGASGDTPAMPTSRQVVQFIICSWLGMRLWPADLLCTLWEQELSWNSGRQMHTRFSRQCRTMVDTLSTENESSHLQTESWHA